MLIRTTNPQLIIDKRDYDLVNGKLTELNIEIVSKHERGEQVSFHIYGKRSQINKLIEWLSDDFNGVAELEE